MVSTLRRTIRGEPPPAGSTANALIRRGLLRSDGTLTRQGWIRSLEFVSLSEQCKQIGIRLELLTIEPHPLGPERAAWQYLRGRGFIGTHCEGGAILTLIKASCLEFLVRSNPFKSRDDACTRFTEAQLTILQESKSELLAAIQESTVDDMVHAFQEIYSHGAVREQFPSLTSEQISALYNAIGPDRLAIIASAIMEDPYAYRSGWPDLTMTRNESVLWGEVKTNDRLHKNQIRTILQMRKLLPGEVLVFRVT